MSLSVSGAERDVYLAGLNEALTQGAQRLGGRRRPYTMACREEAVLLVLAEITNFIDHKAPLKHKKGSTRPIETLEDLTAFALTRLETVFESRCRMARRNLADAAAAHPEDIASASMASPPPAEHPIFDTHLLNALFAALHGDPIALHVALIVEAAHNVPDTPDINICDNAEIAPLIGCTTQDVINARKRIATIKNRLLSRDRD